MPITRTFKETAETRNIFSVLAQPLGFGKDMVLFFMMFQKHRYLFFGLSEMQKLSATGILPLRMGAGHRF
jgi:hypothetical protein